MKKFLLLIVIFVLAGIAYFFVYLDVNKKETKTIARDYSSEFAHEMGRRKTNDQDIYIDLDEYPVYKISNTEIANLIKASLPLNPWLIDPDTLKCGDTIVWNCKAYGFDNNPRIGVIDGHFMWVKARELLEFMHGVSQPSGNKKIQGHVFFELKPSIIRLNERADASGKYRPTFIATSLDYLKKEQMAKDSVSLELSKWNAKVNSSNNTIVGNVILTIVISTLVLLLLSAWSYRLDDGVLIKKILSKIKLKFN